MMRCPVGDKQGNLERSRALAARAAVRGAELLVLPEACLSGYTVRESMAHLAEPVPGPLTRAVAETAAEHGLSILAGLVEAGPDGARYLTQVLVSPQGLVGLHRKTHLGPMESNRFEKGNRLSVVDLDGVRYGLQLCYEGHFPEMTQAQALAGADVVLIPHASPREDPPEKLERWLRYLPARAYDNTVFLAACNQVGDNGRGLSFAGVALILGPKGEVLAQAAGDEDDLVVADLEAERIETIREGRMGWFLPLRRPEIYAGPTDEED